MRQNFFGLQIIENMDDMTDALEAYDIDEFYVSIDKDKEEGFKAYFFLTSDGEPLAETEGWSNSKDVLIEDLLFAFGEDLDIVDM